MNFIVSPWQASTAYQLGQQILDANRNIEEVTKAGTSGSSVPTFLGAGTTIMNDGGTGGVNWVNQGPLSASPLAIWTATTSKSKGNRIVDSNGNIEVVTKNGTTGGSAPAWKTALGATTIDASVNWINAGPTLIAVLPAAGGTSGIIIDNLLNGSLAGTSQVYFTTLSDQVCGTSGTGGCAVQASQPGLD